jgi:hypothetical protein
VRWALLLRELVAVLLWLFVAPEAIAPDILTYDFWGKGVADYWAGDRSSLPGFWIRGDPPAYYFIVGAVYLLFGQWILLPSLLNCFVGAWTVRLTHDVALVLTGDAGVALRSARYVAYFPSLVLWSAVNLRDVWIVALILFVTSRALRLQERPSFAGLTWLMAGIYLLTQFRSYILAAVAFPILLAFVVRRQRQIARNLVIGSLVGLALIYTDVSQSLRRGMELADLSNLQQYRQFTGFGGSQAERNVDISTPLRALTFLPRGFAIFALSPFPWEVRNLRQVATVPEMLFIYWALVPIVIGVGGLIRRRFGDALVALLIAGALTFGYSLGQANIGTAYRYRAQVLPFYLIFAAYGLELRRIRRQAALPVPHPRADA